MKHAELPELSELQHTEMVGRMTEGRTVTNEYLYPVIPVLR